MTPRLLPDALAELDAAIAYYEAQRPGLGVAFYLEVEETIALAIESPGVGVAVPRDGVTESATLRRYVVRRFPYLVWINVDGDGPCVVAIAHASRRPGYWGDRVE